MRQLLQLHPHKHTGKVLHHKHTSFHALFLILGVAGVFMVMLSNFARAADYVVTATVPAPIPAGAPVITSPANGTVILTPAVLIAGTCPVIDPAIIVELFDQTSFLGSQQCSGGGTFSIPVNLTAGAHVITASVITITGDSGQTSQPVTVTYAPPVTPTTPVEHSNNPGTVATSPLTLVSDTPFIVFGYNTDAVWKGTFSGGTPPYSLYIAWGDGSSQTFKNLAAGQHGYNHHYTALKPFHVTVKLSDTSGQAVTRSIAAISPATFNQPPAVSTLDSSHYSLTTLLYVCYGGLLFLLLLYWRYEQDRHLAVATVKARGAEKRQTRR